MTRSVDLRAASLAVSIVSLGCAHAPHPGSSPTSPSALDYRVEALPGAPLVLDITLTLQGGSPALVASVPSAIGLLTRDDGLEIRPIGDRFPIGCASTCRVRYRVDLGAAAARSGDAFEVAARSGADVVGPASTWLLRPDPLPPASPVTIDVRPAPGTRFASGLHRGPLEEQIAVRAIDLPAAGYAAFGSFTVEHVPVHGGAIDLVLLGGERRLGDEAIQRFTARMAGALDAVFGRFPVARAAIFVTPEAGSRRVELGRTLPSGGASILLVIGADAGEAALREDWILEHELFHLGTPSFSGEGRFLDEGMAVYYEPVLRRRAGLRSSEGLWGDLVQAARSGLPGPGQGSLARSEDHDRVYGGGATFVLAADLGIRARTGGARSLDDGLRAVLDRGGDATRVWTVADFVKTVDAATGVPVLTELHARAAMSDPCTIPPFAAGALLPPCLPSSEGDVDHLFSWLGVAHDSAGNLAFVEDGPRASHRRAIEGERPGAPLPAGKVLSTPIVP
ncbi:MAG: hypothetical protein U0359_03250 [Byssovorax sp.]